MGIKITDNDKEVFLAKWIEGEISDSELKKLVSEDDVAAYKKIKAGIAVYQELEKPLDKTFAKVKEKIKALNASKSRTINLYTKIAIAVAASIILFFSLNALFSNSNVDFKSGFGEQKTVVLLDGSQVILNAKSQLKYNKKSWSQHREVILNGEAFFKVKKGSTFTVKTKNGTVTVLGTQCNVNTNPSFFEVVCYTGKVKVVNNDKTYILTPNQTVRNNNGIVTSEDLNLQDQKPSWISGESSFRSVPLKQVILALEKQYSIKIDDSHIDTSIIFTGSFDNKNLNIALSSVFETVTIKYTILDKKIILSK